MEKVGHRVVAALLTASLLATGTQARADEPPVTPPVSSSNDAGFFRTAMFVEYGVAAVSLATSAVFLALASTAYRERRDISRENGDTDAGAWSCRSADQCSRMAGLRLDQERAQTGAAIALGVAGAAALGGTACLFGMLAEKRRSSALYLAPAASPQGGGLQVRGTF